MKRTIYILLIAIQSTFVIKAQDYDILANQTTGCDSVVVLFSLSETTGITSADWNFGEGSSYSGLLPPAITYHVGVYTVNLVINGSDTVTKTNFIGVYPPPPSSFAFTDSNVLGSYNIKFTIEEQDPPFDTVLYFYNWDFDDGTTFLSSQRYHEHKFPSSGDYDVSLTTNDNHGCETVTVNTVDIEDDFVVPNIFTPNGDNKFDNLVVTTNGQSVYTMTIFTRNGTVVYKTEGSVLIWDGRNNTGVKMSSGIYYYIIEEKNNADHQQTGFFYMIYEN